MAVSLDYSLRDFQFHFNFLSTTGSLTPSKPCDEETVTDHIGDVILRGSAFDLTKVDCAGVETLSVAFEYVDSFLPPNLSVSELYNPDRWKAQYLNLAFKYDNGSSLVIAEYGEVSIKGYLNPIGPGGYVLYGYRLNKWLPYFAIGNLVTSDITRKDVQSMADRVSAGLGPATGGILYDLLQGAGVIVKYRSYTLGTNYWINTNLRAKIEVAHYEHFKGTNGFFHTNPGSHNAVYSFSIDGVF